MDLDCSVHGSYGVVASGGVLRNATSQWITGVTRNVGTATITLAELWLLKMLHVFLTNRGCMGLV
ncbi:hypothetical protein SESBI_43903 [Sesbania bispinosa]|nr:hypothetical protein SESBI_43903 [Sesbania bispinosa]